MIFFGLPGTPSFHFTPGFPSSKDLVFHMKSHDEAMKSHLEAMQRPMTSDALRQKLLKLRLGFSAADVQV
jgi:hypothetical protein